MDCAYNVPIPHGMALKMDFKDFLLEASSKYSKEW